MDPAPIGGGGGGDQQPSDWPNAAPPTQARGAYPIVLVHGLDGFKNIGPLNYFNGVADALSKEGHQVFVPQVASYNSSEVRGAQLLTYVEDVLAQTGAEKVNLLCHSQGGLDCRYVANKLPARVASVTTIAAPHHGTPIADIVEGDLPGPLQDATHALLDLIGAVVSGGQMDQNAQAALQALSSKGTEAFNAKYPDQPGVAYYSIAGRASNSLGGDACGTSTPAPFITKYDQITTGAGIELMPSSLIIQKSFDPPPSNDGLVPSASARWGIFLGCIPADHLGEMCHIPQGSAGSGVDCVQVYRDIATYLVAHGF
jgi:triacylglycerol lipase